jgi:hypothetical protein
MRNLILPTHNTAITTRLQRNSRRYAYVVEFNRRAVYKNNFEGNASIFRRTRVKRIPHGHYSIASEKSVSLKRAPLNVCTGINCIIGLIVSFEKFIMLRAAFDSYERRRMLIKSMGC